MMNIRVKIILKWQLINKHITDISTIYGKAQNTCHSLKDQAQNLFIDVQLIPYSALNFNVLFRFII